MAKEVTAFTTSTRARIAPLTRANTRERRSRLQGQVGHPKNQPERAQPSSSPPAPLLPIPDPPASHPHNRDAPGGTHLAPNAIHGPNDVGNACDTSKTKE
ncbi:hypothetical protein FA13DRAFT_1806907 [Coprinellus micaceus]|uniref:Uncharacterized protein n=1 Tax=Coprinellus micaceus TaxID=71717 RepID=A0A4Y7RII6_COPMI|nr:hypothetical protein FA13DRAFT_1806907 [Coprinellus micaceus]